jgi:quinolinate synthase
MFGDQVVDTVKRYYDDAYVTAHLEVPGEMFEIAMAKSLEGKGVTGSTSNILQFISDKVEEAAKNGSTDRLKFILGTEAGMVTSIVKSVQDILAAHQSEVEAEIIFPVASEAVMAVDESDHNNHSNLSLVPGVAGGEGCSTAGGCATCPFMKMNDLDALQDIIDMVEQGMEVKLRGHLPPQRLAGKQINNVSALELGIEPILHMRALMKDKVLPDELIQKVRAHAS